MPSQSQCQKQPATTIKLVGDECVNKVTLIALCAGDGGGGGGGVVTVDCLSLIIVIMQKLSNTVVFLNLPRGRYPVS